MNSVPEKPCEIPAELQPGDTDHCVVHSQRNQNTLRNIYVTLQRFAAFLMHDVSCRDTSFRDGHWRDSRRVLRRKRRARIAHHEHLRMSFQLEMVIHNRSADSVVRPWQGLHQFHRAYAWRPGYG